jgi:tryptophan synthase alpha chain
MSALTDGLRRCRQTAQPAVAGFLPAGYPDPDRFVAAVGAAFAAGAVAMEVGVPLSPPVLDGPVVADAFGKVRLAVADQLELVRSVAELGPIVVMSYARGVPPSRLAEHASEVARAGAIGLLVPDIDTGAQLRLAGALCVPTGVFVSNRDDLELVVGHDGEPPGFVYLRSSGQITGQAIDLSTACARLGDVRAGLAGQDILIFVGFGVRTRAQVADLLASGADVVVVGTAVVEAAGESADAVTSLIRHLCAPAGSGRG